MKKVTLKKIRHKGEEQLGIGFTYDDEIKSHVKAFTGVRWSQTLKTFYVPFSKEITNQLFQHLRAKKLYVDYSALQKPEPAEQVRPKKKITLGELPKPYEKAIENFAVWMRQKRYSDSTIKTYCSMVKLFLTYHSPKKIVELNKDDLLSFNTHYILANNYSFTFQNQLVNALKLFYSRTGGHQMQIDRLERPKKQKRLPEVLSINEVKELLGTVKNMKHKTLLSLLYSCGLRIGESLKLELNHIDLERRLLHVKAGKGRKDRFIPLSQTMVGLLKKYYAQYRPVKLVFEGVYKKAYSPVSARQVLKRALAHTNITKYVTLHTLRHSYATHLLENGTDIRFIQELLGHNDPKTTMIYTHVSTTSLEKIKNPFDDFEI